MDWGEVLGVFGGASVVAVAAAVFVARRIETEMDRRLEKRQAVHLEALKHEHQREVQALQQVEARLTSQFGVAASLETAAHSATLKHRIEAIEKMWGSIIWLRDNMPTGLGLMDGVTEKEYAEFRRSELVMAALPDTNAADKFKRASDYVANAAVQIDQQRPFVSELLWQCAYAYRAIMGNVVVLGVAKASMLAPWYKDENICALVKTVLSAEEFDRALSGKRYQLRAVREAIERHILDEMRRELTGEHASNRAIDRANAIRRAVEKVESANLRAADRP